MDDRTLRLLEYADVRAMVRERACSPMGRELASRMRPVRDPQIVRIRQQETTEARARLEDGSPPLGGLRDVREPVRLAEKHGVLTPHDLQDVAETAATCRRMRRYLADTYPRFPTLHAQAHLLNEFQPLERAVDAAIAPNGDVLDTASPELGRARKRVRALNEEIARELQRLLTAAAVVDKLQEPIITQRNGRFCVPVRAESRSHFKGIVHDISASGQTAFMEPLSVVELGNDLREAESREQEEVLRVLTQLSEAVGRIASALLASMDAVARLDVIFARAALAQIQRASAPLLNTDGIIELAQARHPLLGDTAVPIDIMLGDDNGQTLLITGPNTGGKTVSLKTVGLFTLMAQSGMHIPAAEGSRLAIMDQIFADIGDEQSIAQSLSTFSSHMTTIVRIIAEAGPRALVLFDEIGAGTDPAEGAALAKAILLELHERGCRTIATTHYGELKTFAQTTDGFANASVEFDMDTLRPTYRVIRGLPGSSNALSIAQRLGLPKATAMRARELMGDAPQAMEQVLKQAEGVRRALDRERSAAAHARREADTIANTLKREQEAFEEKRAAAMAQARLQAQEIVQKARLEAADLLDELKTVIRETREQTPPGDTHAQMRRRVKDSLGTVTASVAALPDATRPSRQQARTERPALTAVIAGQPVFVRSLGHKGTALTSAGAGEEVEVQVGIMRMSVPVGDLESAGALPVAPPPPPGAAIRQVEPEIHLLGQRAEEAATRLDEYLYEAFEGGHRTVRIVHGFGTGVLRQMVHAMLRSHPVVRHYQTAEQRQGGGGVTIAELGPAA
jgi:DNA mismatch repair protein MutS2